jgi:putative endonuclease
VIIQKHPNHNQKVGAFGEDLAKEYLIKKGYKIIGTNIKTGNQELDIIALKDNILVFIEVKTRASLIYGEADEAIFRKKVRNLKRAVNKYLSSSETFYQDARLDLISIDLDCARKIAKIKHYKEIA